MRRRRLLRVRLVLLLLLCAWRASKVMARKERKDATHSDEPDEYGLVWEHLSVTGSHDAVILHTFSGHVPAGQLCGILGPSGSGKSTFLSALGSLLTLPVDGVVYSYRQDVVGTTKSKSRKKKNSDDDVNNNNESTLVYQRISSNQVAWLQQHDDFFSLLTVQETLDLAAFLELPHVSVEDRAALVQGQLRRLGLLSAAHRLVGEASSTTGARISGGERRRLAVALELLTEKQLLLADEATSGLDASMSHKVVDLLRQVAVDQHIPVFLSLHQPRSSIWKLLDHVIVMAVGGHVCYAGPREDCLPYFTSLGYPCPSETNPAEFLMDLVSIGEDPQDKERVHHMIDAFVEHQAQDPKLPRKGALVRRENNAVPTLTGPWHVFRRFGALLRRSWRQNIRNTGIHTFRLVASALNAVLLAAIFPSVAPGQQPSPSSVADRVALLSFGAINMCFIAFMKTITLIAEERPVVKREQTRSQYSSLEYLVAKVIADLPMDSLFAGIFTTVLKQVSGLRIAWTHVTATFSLLTTAGASLGLALGCWSPSSDMAKTGSIPILVLLMVVGVINPSGVSADKKPPLLVRWIKQFSPFAHAIEALCLGEYPGMEFGDNNSNWITRVRDMPKMGGLALVQNGDQVIEALGLATTTYGSAMQQLALLSGGYLLLSWLGLSVQQWLPKMTRARSIQQKSYPNATQSPFEKATIQANTPVKAPIKIPVT